ncbi:MAG: hypothetical protein M0007_01700 [Actinomycetota bacterium]|nr:hypothetical protein [Actinomycetota bacterium]
MLSRQASDGLDARWSLLAGLLTGVALVTKLTAWPLVVSVPLWIFFRPGVARETRPAIGLALAFWVGAAVASGWWFVRNLVLYHHLVAVNALATTARALRTHPTSPGIGVHGIHTVSRVVEEMITYLWVPTEYYRNLVDLPVVAKGAVALVTAYIVVVGGVVVLRRLASGRHRDGRGDIRATTLEQEALISAWTLIGITGAVAFVGWAVIFVWITALAGRLAYLGIPLWAALTAVAVNRTAAALRSLPTWLLPLTATVVLLAADAWFVHLGHHVPVDPFRITFPSPPKR